MRRSKRLTAAAGLPVRGRRRLTDLLHRNLRY